MRKLRFWFPKLIGHKGDFALTAPSLSVEWRLLGPVNPSLKCSTTGEDMDKKHSTIIFVPHARAKFRKVRISHRVLFSAVSLLTSSLCLSTFFSVQYFASISRTHELSKLKHENRDLKQANAEFSKSVQNLRGELKNVEDKTRKLAIIAGINPADESALQGGVGGVRQPEIPAASPYRDELDQMSYRSRNLQSDLSVLEKTFVERHQLLSSTPSIAPVRGILTCGFGGRSDPFTGEPASHLAIDISSASGQPIRSPADGIVAKAEWANGYGNVVYMAHGYGYSTRYGHLSSFAVKPGQRVKRGDVIGYVGSTGRSTGPHLHYEVRMNNEPVNPLAYILNAF
jgi:murein DD-endopeptidase MepM/ murein hydrolase activator NlpD